MAGHNMEKFLAELQDAPGWMGGNVLDVRSSQLFTEGHLAGSASHPLEESPGPWEPGYLEEELPSIFLPPRHEPLVVVAARQEQADSLAVHLAGRDRAVVTGLALPPGAAGLLPADLKRAGQ